MSNNKPTIIMNGRLAKIKSNAVKLRGNYQLPSKLVYYIMQLNVNCSEYWISYLMECSYLYCRLPNFYKKYPKLEEKYNAIITEHHDMLREQGVQGI